MVTSINLYKLPDENTSPIVKELRGNTTLYALWQFHELTHIGNKAFRRSEGFHWYWSLSISDHFSGSRRRRSRKGEQANNDTTLSRPDKSAATCETGPQLWGLIFPVAGLSVNDSALSEWTQTTQNVQKTETIRIKQLNKKMSMVVNDHQ